MSLPALKDWDTTAHNLHNAARLLGTLRLLLFENMPNFLQLPLRVIPAGLSTDTLPKGGEVILDFQTASLVIHDAAGKSQALALSSHTQTTLFEALLNALKSNELAALIGDAKSGSLIDALFAAIQGGPYVFLPNREDLTDTQSFQIDGQLARDYAKALYEIFTGVARFRTRLNGMMTPAVVWPHHFDLSFLWFAGDKADESSPHMNFGFAPFSPGLNRPYLYAYAWPLPEGYAGPQGLPSQAHWHTEGWKGVVVPYDNLVKADDPSLLIENICLAIYKALLPVLRP